MTPDETILLREGLARQEEKVNSMSKDISELKHEIGKVMAGQEEMRDALAETNQQLAVVVSRLEDVCEKQKESAEGFHFTARELFFVIFIVVVIVIALVGGIDLRGLLL